MYRRRSSGNAGRLRDLAGVHEHREGAPIRNLPQFPKMSTTKTVTCSSSVVRFVMTILVTQHVPFEGPAAIARWAYETGHRIELCRLWAGDQLPDATEVAALVIMGGPMSIWEVDRHPWLTRERELISTMVAAGRPVLGICLGAQQIAAALGASVFRGHQKEIGFFPVELDPDGWRGLLSARTPLPSRTTVFHWHGDTFTLPETAAALASSPATPVQGFRVGTKTVALQFHLESTERSVVSLASAAGGEIGRGTYQVAPSHTLETLISDQRRHGGACNALLFALLDQLFGVAGSDGALPVR